MTELAATEIATAAVGVVMEISPNSVTSGSRLVEDLGMDSIAFVQLADVLEARLAATGSSAVIDDSALLRFATVRDVVQHLMALA